MRRNRLLTDNENECSGLIERFTRTREAVAPHTHKKYPQSKNLCHTLRRKRKWQGYCILPVKAFYPGGLPKPRKLSEHPSAIRGREAYHENPLKHQILRAKQRKNHPDMHKRSWAKRKDAENARRRKRYATDTEYADAEKARARRRWANVKDEINPRRRKNYKAPAN